MLANELGKAYDDDGVFAAGGKLNTALLTQLNALPYYRQPFPKSLANNFGVEEVYLIIQSYAIPVEDALRTYSEHITQQMVCHKRVNDQLSCRCRYGRANAYNRWRRFQRVPDSSY